MTENLQKMMPDRQPPKKRDEKQKKQEAKRLKVAKTEQKILADFLLCYDVPLL